MEKLAREKEEKFAKDQELAERKIVLNNKIDSFVTEDRKVCFGRPVNPSIPYQILNLYRPCIA